MNRETAVKLMAAKVAMIDALVAECKELAYENGIDFDLDIDYEINRQKNTLDNGGWQSSSYNC